MPALSKLPCGNGGGSGGDADFQLGDVIYDMPITAYSACANYYKNELYLCSYSRYNNGRCYKYDGSTWTELSSPPNNYYHNNWSLASGVFNNRIYYISTNSSIYSYDGNSYTYVSINNPYNITLGNFIDNGSVVVNNKLYLGGGASLIYIDPDNNVFGAGSIPTGGAGGDNVPVFTRASILVADDNNIYGIVNHADASFCKWITYNPNTDNWSSLNMIANYFSDSPCAFTYNNIAYQMVWNYYTDAGNGNSYNTYAIYKRNPDNSVTCVLILKSGMGYFQYNIYNAVVTDNGIWLLCGNSNNNLYARVNLIDKNAGSGGFFTPTILAGK